MPLNPAITMDLGVVFIELFRISTKLELLVIANQHVAVNTFPGFVHTARQTMKVGNTRSQWANPQGRQLSKVGSMIGVKS